MIASAPVNVARVKAPSGWDARLDEAGRRLAAPWSRFVDAADVGGLVLPRSRWLCAALGELAGVTFDALASDPARAERNLPPGPGRKEADALSAGDLRARVTHAAAGLSLLTKVDDQQIDGRDFHGLFPRGELRERTRAHLAPTLASIVERRALNDEPRCKLASEVGRWAHWLATDEDRHGRLVDLIARGWETQVDAVVTFSAHPRDVDAVWLDDVTARVSGLWLAMMCAVGTLPHAAGRALTAQEERAILRWGLWMQRADALADLGRDLADGLTCTVVGHALWSRDPEGYDRALAHGDGDAADALVQRYGIDRALRPGAHERRELADSLGSLGELASLLGWTLDHLLGRYDARRGR